MSVSFCVSFRPGSITFKHTWPFLNRNNCLCFLFRRGHADNVDFFLLPPSRSIRGGNKKKPAKGRNYRSGRYRSRISLRMPKAIDREISIASSLRTRSSGENNLQSMKSKINNLSTFIWWTQSLGISWAYPRCLLSPTIGKNNICLGLGTHRHPSISSEKQKKNYAAKLSFRTVQLQVFNKFWLKDDLPLSFEFSQRDPLPFILSIPRCYKLSGNCQLEAMKSTKMKNQISTYFSFSSNYKDLN